MVNELKLSWNELIVYAVIYWFSQDWINSFNWSSQYLADFIGSSQRTVFNILKSLIDKNLIKKEEVERNGVKFCEYRAIKPILENNDDFPTSENHSEEIREYKPEKITEEINNVIFLLKEQADKIGIAYDRTDERKFAKHILTAKEYNAFAKKCWYDPIEFAKLIMQASVQVDYWKGACAWPKTIYQNYPEVFNKVIKEKNKMERNKIVEF